MFCNKKRLSLFFTFWRYLVSFTSSSNNALGRVNFYHRYRETFSYLWIGDHCISVVKKKISLTNKTRKTSFIQLHFKRTKKMIWINKSLLSAEIFFVIGFLAIYNGKWTIANELKLWLQISHLMQNIGFK